MFHNYQSREPYKFSLPLPAHHHHRFELGINLCIIFIYELGRRATNGNKHEFLIKSSCLHLGEGGGLMTINPLDYRE